MTYIDLLKEHAAAEGITTLNSFGHGHLLYRGEWFGDQFRPGIDPEEVGLPIKSLLERRHVGLDIENLCMTVVDVLTGPSDDVTHKLDVSDY